VNNCAKSNIIILTIALIGASLFSDNTDKQITALQAQISAKDKELVGYLASAVKSAENAKMEAETLKKSLQAKGCVK